MEIFGVPEMNSNIPQVQSVNVFNSYAATAQYKLIYIYTIHDDAHEGKGLIKIGKASFNSHKSENQLPENCEELNLAAKVRINQQTQTALVQYELLHTELAIRHFVMSDGTPMTQAFDDTDVHAVLYNSGKSSEKFMESGKPSEWFKVDLETAQKAIKAVKMGHSILVNNAQPTPVVPKAKTNSITLRKEQEDCVSKTIECFKTYDSMLWDCKMRFGKTITAYELIRREIDKYKKVIVITHRPAVEDGWASDHDVIFDKESGHIFVDKSKGSEDDFDENIDANNNKLLADLLAQNASFTYFASIHDLRGSKRVGGKFKKNEGVYDLDWDLVIIDEAHEGTKTELGEAVIKNLIKPNTKLLQLSGTPYNLITEFEENVYSWTYVDEQKAKEEWENEHPGEKNPYAELPKMNILTFDLCAAMADSYLYETEDQAFNFREFFRTWTGDKEKDYHPVPEGKKIGDFVHESDVNAFLDLITKEDSNTNYPFSKEEYRDMFRHTFWLVPGVKEAKALSALMKQHKVFKKYYVVNVAGDGDEEIEYDSALKAVRDAIHDNEYTITISCGRLTTGVTVREWTGAMMLSGSAKTAAGGYMQAIFRVQSPGCVNGKQKENVYVFDFAPDRALSVVAEVHNITHKESGSENAKVALGEFINFCPIIAVEGTVMRPYDVPEMMRQIKRISIESAINSGFDDDVVFDRNAGIIFKEGDEAIIKKLGDVLTPQKKGKKKTTVTIADNGMTEEQRKKAEAAAKKQRNKRTPEEQEAYEKLQKQKKEQQKLFNLLRAIVIRLPLLFYGAEADITEAITLENFVKIVDAESWEEFMPANLTKDFFLDLLHFFDKDIVEGAGMRIRRLAKAADELPPTKRAARIVEILSKFRNPDKETVLTPWRVVNMHLSETLGGYCFFNEDFTKELDEPRLVEQSDVTADIFLNPDAKILEMNSKSGLYPLYMAFGIYMLLVDGKESDISFEKANEIWKKTVSEHIFVLCKTPMACSITKRTLVGFADTKINAIYLTKLIERMQDKERIARKITNPETWGIEGERMKFDAVCGNPPYQLMDGGSGPSASPLYQMFIETAKAIKPNYISMISPSRWFAGGKGLDEFRDSMLNDKRIQILIDYPNSADCFAGVDIAGGVSYFLWNKNYCDDCLTVTKRGKKTTSVKRSLNEFDIFIRSSESLSIIKKVLNKSEKMMDEIVLSRNPFGFESKSRGLPLADSNHNIKLIHSQGVGFVAREEVQKNSELVSNWKVSIGKLVPSNGEVGIDPSKGYNAMTKPRLMEPNTVITDSYLILATFPEKEKAKNFCSFMRQKMPRFLMHETFSSMNISRSNFRFVPFLDFTQEWLDEDLYSKYGLTESEIQFIEGMIRPMNDGDDSE